MAKKESFYTPNLRGETVEELRRELGFELQRISNLIDELAGKRGEPKFFADVNANSMRFKNVGTPRSDTDVERVDHSLRADSPNGAFNAKGRRILNVDDALEPTEAVNLSQLRLEFESSLTNRFSSAVTFESEVQINGALNHDGTTAGFYGTAPITQPAASANLTDNSGGTANDTIAAITQTANAGSADIGPTQDAVADLASKVNKALSVLRDLGLMAT